MMSDGPRLRHSDEWEYSPNRPEWPARGRDPPPSRWWLLLIAAVVVLYPGLVVAAYTLCGIAMLIRFAWLLHQEFDRLRYRRGGR
jgi:hypothetical protein